LAGIAKNDAEKRLVTKLATDINGVTSMDFPPMFTGFLPVLMR